MKRKLSFYLHTLLLLTFLSTSNLQAQSVHLGNRLMSKFVSDTTFHLSPDVKETHLYYLNAEGDPMAVYILKIHLKKNQLALEATGAFDGNVFSKQTLTQQIALKNEDAQKVLAGINAGFFNMKTGEPVEVEIIDGHVWKDTISPKRYFVGVKRNGKVIIGNAELYKKKKHKLKEALGAFPLLLKHGKILTQAKDGFSTIRHPRTALGIINNRTILWVVVDGRQPDYSNGMPLDELALLMKTLGAKKAVNLDGGGSSTFVSFDINKRKWKVRNRPSGGRQRAIANAWVVVKKE